MYCSEEIRLLLEESSKSGIISLSEHQLLENVFEFADTPVKQIMVPRGKIVGIEATMNIVEIHKQFVNEGYSRMPVYKDSIDNIIGIFYAKDILKLNLSRDDFDIKKIIRPAYFINEERKINEVLRKMQKGKIHLSIVLDEFSGTAGLVTLEDIIEEIFGEIQDEYDEETPIVEKTGDNSFTVNALATISDANDFLPKPLPESEDYETVGGLITSEVGRIPEVNETIELENYDCKIIKRSDRSIELVKLTYIKNRDEENQEVY